MVKKTQYEEMMCRLGGKNEEDRHSIRCDLIESVYQLRDNPDTRFVYDMFYDLHGGGEFQRDAAIEAMVNGWSRDENGRLPFGRKIHGYQWFETEAKGASDRIARILESAVTELRNRRNKEADEDKRKKELRDSLRNQGYKKMWVKIETGFLGSATVDIFDGKMYLKVVGGQIEMRKA